MSKEQSHRRVAYIDIAKGIGIILVILGHAFRDEMRMESNICEFVYQAIYFFHMPLFFAISGITLGLSYQKYLKEPKRFILKRIQTQVVPVFTYATVIYICFFVAYHIPMLQQALSSTGYLMYSYPEYLKLTVLLENPYSIHLWYLCVVFIFTNIAFFLFRCCFDNKKIRVVFVVGAVVLYVFSVYAHLSVFFHTIFENLVYFAIGILMSSMQELIFKKNKFINMAMLAGWIFMLVYCGLYAARYEFKVLYWEFILNCFKLVANMGIIFSILKLSDKLVNCKPILYCGKESYSIYLLHQPFCCGFVGVVLYNKLGFPVPVVYVLCCLLSILLPAVAVAVCRKIKLVGKIGKSLFNIV